MNRQNDMVFQALDFDDYDLNCVVDDYDYHTS